MEPILLIWDIDGTLMSSKGIGRRAMDSTFKRLYDIESGFKNVEMSGRLDYQIIRDAHDNHSIPSYDLSRFYEAYEIELKDEIKSDTKASVLAGIIDILERNNENIYHILGTGNCEIGARLKLSHVGLDHYFRVGGFGDEDKDRWQIIEKGYNLARSYYNIDFKKSNTYVIGDTPHDINCAKRMGVKSIAVATGSHSYKELEKYDSDYLLDKMDLIELDRILNE